MLGSDKSRGYCLEMICADFLAGAYAEDESPRTLLVSILRLVRLLPVPERQELAEAVGAGSLAKTRCNRIGPENSGTEGSAVRSARFAVYSINAGCWLKRPQNASTFSRACVLVQDDKNI
jgi:hypothetical protein